MCLRSGLSFLLFYVYYESSPLETGRTSAWDYALVAIVHPTLVTARAPLAALGWRVLERDMPFPLFAIENQVWGHKKEETNVSGFESELLSVGLYKLH